MRPSSLVASSTFRRALLAALVLWALLSGALVLLQHAAAIDVIERFGERVNDEIEAIRAEAVEHMLLAPEGSAPLVDEVLDIGFPDDAGTVEALALYAAEIRRQLARDGLDDRHRRALRVRLALLGEETIDALRGQPLDAYAELMLEEVPERHRDALWLMFEHQHAQLEERFDAGGRGVKGAALAAAMVEIDEVVELAEDPSACLEIRSAEGAVLLASAGQLAEAGPAGGALRLYVTSNEDAAAVARVCVGRDFDLGGGARLRFGRDFTSPLTRIDDLAGLGYLAIGAGLVLALVAGLAPARPVARLLADLRRIRGRLNEGDYRARLRRRGRGDAERAAAEVNGMLDQLERLMVSLQQVTDNIAHDLRTPLTRLQGQLDLLQRATPPNAAVVEAVQEEANQVLATFNALLRIAQVESGSRRRGFRRFDLARVVADVGELYAPAFAEQRIAFEHTGPASPVFVEGDADLWMQALSNLIDNALKYTQAAGAVSLALSVSPAPEIVLKDTGPGIPEAERENVFRRFYRLERHRADRGNGLGLSLVAAICDLHRATIELDHDGGLVVRIRFSPPELPRS